MGNGHGKRGGPREMKKKNRTVVFIFVLIFLFIFFDLIGQGFAQVRKQIGKSNGWREIQFNFGTLDPPFFSWCVSSKHLIFGGKGGKGIRLLDVESGNIQELTTDVRNQYPSCTHEGRYVFFTDMRYTGEYKNLYVYDFRTKRITNIYSLHKPLPIRNVYEPLSPSNKYLIGPPNWKDKITLPGGVDVKIVPIYEASLDINIIDYYSRERWSLDGETLYLLKPHSQTFFVRDLKTNKQTSIPLKIKEYSPRDIKPSPDGTKIYIDALKDDEKTSLFVLNLRESIMVPELFIDKILYFDVSPDGSILFSRIDGDYNRLYLLDSGKKIKLIREFQFYAWPIHPRVSKDGKAIAYLRKLKDDENLIVVLIKE